MAWAFCCWSPHRAGSLGKDHLPNNWMVQDTALTEDFEVLLVAVDCLRQPLKA